MKLIFVNRFYWPEEPATAQLLTDLAEGLASGGWQVTVLASHPGGSTLQREEWRNGVRIVRMRGPRLGKRSVAGRAIDFAVFIVGVAAWLLRNLDHASLVVAKTDPPMLGTWLWPVVASRRARLLHWTQDIYPEVAQAVGRSKSLRFLLSCLRIPRNISWRMSCGCVAPGPDMTETIRKSGVAHDRVWTIENWAPAGVHPGEKEQIASWRRSWGMEEAFVVLYSGNLGRVHDLEPLVELASILRDCKEIVFAFIGDGAKRTAIEGLARERRLENIRFLPAQPRRLLSVSLSAGDLLAVTLHPECVGAVFPSKLYGIAAVGRPVLFVGPAASSIHRLVRDQRIGMTFTRDQMEDAARAIREFSRDRTLRDTHATAARLYGQTHGTAARAIAEWNAVLSGIASAPRGGRT